MRRAGVSQTRHQPRPACQLRRHPAHAALRVLRRAKAERAERRAAQEAAKAERRERERQSRLEKEREREGRERAAREHFAALQRQRRAAAQAQAVQAALLASPVQPQVRARKGRARGTLRGGAQGSLVPGRLGKTHRLQLAGDMGMQLLPGCSRLWGFLHALHAALHSIDPSSVHPCAAPFPLTS